MLYVNVTTHDLIEEINECINLVEHLDASKFCDQQAAILIRAGQRIRGELADRERKMKHPLK